MFTLPPHHGGRRQPGQGGETQEVILVCIAIEKELFDLGQGAEIMGIPLEDMKMLLANWV